MATERATQPGKVRIWLPDVQEGDIVPHTDDHDEVLRSAKTDLKLYAQREGFGWLFRGDASLRYLRIDGSTGQLFPDLLIVRDRQASPTGPYTIEEAGKAPDLILEVVSPSTAREDLNLKVIAYAQMGVAEYVIFDPRRRARPALSVYRLATEDSYALLSPEPDGTYWLTSIELRVSAEPGGDRAGIGPRLRFFRANGQPLLHIEEEVQARQDAERREQAAERARQEAERARQEEREARERAEQARQRAEQEQARLRAEIARLLAQRAPEAGDDPQHTD